MQYSWCFMSSFLSSARRHGGACPPRLFQLWSPLWSLLSLQHSWFGISKSSRLLSCEHIIPGMFKGVRYREFIFWSIASIIVSKWWYLQTENVTLACKSGLRVMLMLLVGSLEYWSFELLVLLSGLLPNPKIELSVLSIWYDICLSWSAFSRMPLQAQKGWVIMKLLSPQNSCFISSLFCLYYLDTPIVANVDLLSCSVSHSLNTAALTFMIPFGVSAAVR